MRLPDLLARLIDRGRTKRPEGGATSPKPALKGKGRGVEQLRSFCQQLLSGRGEASGLALAAEIIRLYGELDVDARLSFFHCLAEEFGPDWGRVREAWAVHEASPVRDNFRTLTSVLEPARQELFRRINRAPGGTAALVNLRADLLKAARDEPELLIVDDDLTHLLHSWFNRGFLIMQRIDWSTPADLLERIIKYEAVHQIADWEDLRRRLLPPDRRCYAFFHPAMAGDPLIFVEVALAGAIPDSIQGILAKDRGEADARTASTAVFYSISNCQPGLQGISFGNFLIKQVVEDLSRELPRLSTFVTLSPVPGFRRWAETSEAGLAALATAGRSAWPADPIEAETDRAALLGLAANYFLEARDAKGRPIDPVARFHLGNGARLERLCWLGDRSAKGMRESAGLMVNYLYDLRSVEANHEAFANDGQVIASQAVKALRPSDRNPKGASKQHVR